MRLNKRQIAVITVLNVVIAALVAAIFLLPAVASANGGGGGNGGNTDVITPPTDEHEKLREPTAGRVPQIQRETRLMGTGDETVEAVHFVDGIAFIFGNATVSGLDFDSYGGFLCMVGSKGNILGFTYFDGRLTAVGVAEGGFAAATIVRGGTDEAVARLYSVDYDGKAEAVATLDGAASDIIAIGGTRVAVVTKPNVNSFKLTEYAVTGDGWAAEHNTRITSGYTLDYFDCYRLGDGYILAARAYSLPRYDSIVFYTFEAGGDATAHFYGGSGDSIMQPYAVMPYPEGYVALCRRNGVAAIVTVDYTFMSYRRDLLGFAFDGARLLYCNDLYYACFDSADGSTVYELDEKLNRRTLSAADGMSPSCAIKSAGAIIVGATDDGKAKLTDASGSRALSLDIQSGVFYGGYRTTDGNTVIVLSATGGDALTAPSGGRDVYVICVKI